MLQPDHSQGGCQEIMDYMMSIMFPGAPGSLFVGFHIIQEITFLKEPMNSLKIFPLPIYQRCHAIQVASLNYRTRENKRT